ncbi:MAG: hypothetical protein R3A79_26210 [Nannocystaceae bacterium]
MEEQRTRIIVINFAPRARGLVRALVDFFPGDVIDLVCTGDAPVAAAEAALVGIDGVEGRYFAGSVSQGVDNYTALLEARVDPADAAAIIVLPKLESVEVDAHSRLTCVALQRAIGGAPMPTVVVAIEDPEASFEFSGLGVTTIFYPGFLRAALFAHACVELPVFHFILALLRGRFRLQTIPVSEDMRARTFGDACMTLERDPEGRPLALVGLFAADPEGGAPVMAINPGRRYALRDAQSLLAIAERRP